MSKQIILTSMLLFCICLCLCGLMNRKMSQNTKQSSHGLTEPLNVTLLLSDGLNYSVVIQFTDSTMKQGYAKVYPGASMNEKDISWIESRTIEGNYYPVMVKNLNDEERQILRRIEQDFNKFSYQDPNEVKDDYQYILYINDRKVASLYFYTFDEGEAPKKILNDISEIISIPSTLYPTDWIVN